MNKYYIYYKKYRKNPFFLSLAVHISLFFTLVISSFWERPQIIHAVGAADKPIIQAGLVDNKAVKNAVARQEQQEQNKQKQLAMQKANAEKIKKEAERAKLEAQKLKQEVAVAQKKAEQEKKVAIAEQKAAEQAKLQATKEHEKAKLAKEQAVAKLEKVKQVKEKAALEHELAMKEQARINTERARQAQEQAMAAQQLAERGRWIDSELSRYANAIKQKVYNHRTLSSAFASELVCKIQIKLLPEGSVHEVKIIQSSGNAAYDSMSEAAVLRAAPFDMAEDQELNSRLRDIILEFTNNEDNG